MNVRKRNRDTTAGRDLALDALRRGERQHRPANGDKYSRRLGAARAAHDEDCASQAGIKTQALGRFEREHAAYE